MCTWYAWHHTIYTNRQHHRSHSRRITGLQVVDRGRNIISSSKDGTAKLWDCSTAACIGDLYRGGSEVNACALVAGVVESGSAAAAGGGGDGGGSGSGGVAAAASMHKAEVGTEGKLLVLALENGLVTVVDVRTRTAALDCIGGGGGSSGSGAAATCCTWTSLESVVAGAADGAVSVWDTRNPSNPIVKHWKHESPVTTVAKMASNSEDAAAANTAANTFLVGYDDGIVTRWESSSVIDGDGVGAAAVAFQTELTGLDCAAPVHITHHNSSLVVAGADGVVRYYGSLPR